MAIAVVSQKGAVVIPAELRKKYGIEPGTRINFVEINGWLQLIILPRDPIQAAKGFLKGKKSALKMLQEGRKEDAAHEKRLEFAFIGDQPLAERSDP